MRRAGTGVIALVLACVGAARLGAQEPLPADRFALVRAQVVQAQEKDSVVTAVLKVTHVYFGPKDLAGRQIPQRSYIGEGSHFGGDIMPALEPGEVGIWLLELSREGAWAARWREGFGRRWPARTYEWPQPGGPESAPQAPKEPDATPADTQAALRKKYAALREATRFDQAEALAKVVEEVAAKPVDEQEPLWRQHALSPIPDVARCGVVMAVQVGRRRQEAFLKELTANPKAALSARIAADEQLTEQDKLGWPHSPERARLLEAWMSSPLSEFDARSALARLDLSWQREEIDGLVLTKLIRTFAFNEALPVPVRRDSCWVVGRFVKRRSDFADLVLDGYAEILRKSPEPDIRSGAAWCIRNFIPLNSKRLDVLKALKAEIKDPQAERILNMIIETASPPRE